MRPVVALLEARPVTIADDYRRLLTLAGLAVDPERAPLLVAAAGDGAGQPGVDCPPWQLAAALAGARPGGRVFAVAASGGRGQAPARWWDGVLQEAGASPAAGADWDQRRVRPEARVPVLEAVLPQGPSVPAGLQEGGALLLAVPAVGGGWPVAGAVALLMRLLAAHPARPRRFPLAELAAETVALAREALQPAGALLDATVWHGDEGGLARTPVGRNVILAGSDPVAVDAVACRLAGVDPLRVPWLRLCSERGLGECRPERIRLVGQSELVDLDFALPQRTLGAADRLPVRRPWADLLYNLVRRPRVLRGHRTTPWGRLAEAAARDGKAL